MRFTDAEKISCCVHLISNPVFFLIYLFVLPNLCLDKIRFYRRNSVLCIFQQIKFCIEKFWHFFVFFLLWKMGKALLFKCTTHTKNTSTPGFFFCWMVAEHIFPNKGKKSFISGIKGYFQLHFPLISILVSSLQIYKILYAQWIEQNNRCIEHSIHNHT